MGQRVMGHGSNGSTKCELVTLVTGQYSKTLDP